eukprot:gene5889-11893_t
MAVYVRGISKNVSQQDLLQHFSNAGKITKIDFEESPRRGYCWISFESSDAASAAARVLNHSELKGSVLSVRLELGIDSSGVRIIRPSSLAPRIQTVHSISNKKDRVRHQTVSYTGNGVLVDGMLHPTPQGRYLTQLLRQCHSSRSAKLQPLLDILTETAHGNKHAKEISESMAMVDALVKLGEMTGTLWEALSANVFVLADGRTPYTSAALAMFMPDSWQFWSIDPLLSFDPAKLGAYESRIHLVPAMSQTFTCPTSPTLAPLVNIVIACHSHAPLQEFWDRLPAPKYCVSMPCCGRDWSSLIQEPLTQYDDYEVFSPKRKVFLYCTIDK